MGQWSIYVDESVMENVKKAVEDHQPRFNSKSHLIECAIVHYLKWLPKPKKEGDSDGNKSLEDGPTVKKSGAQHS